MSEVDQQQKEAALVTIINVIPRGDDQSHLLEFLRPTSETAASGEDLLFRLREVCSPEVLAKRSITNNPNHFLAIRQLVTRYDMAVRRGIGFPVIHGVLEALVTDDLEQLQDALRVWKAPAVAAETSAAQARTATQENKIAVGGSNNALLLTLVSSRVE
jgi:hypothetical protein